MLDIIIAGAIALSPMDAATEKQDVISKVQQAGTKTGKIRINDSFNMDRAGTKKGKIRVGTKKGKIRI